MKKKMIAAVLSALLFIIIMPMAMIGYLARDIPLGQIDAIRIDSYRALSKGVDLEEGAIIRNEDLNNYLSFTLRTETASQYLDQLSSELKLEGITKNSPLSILKSDVIIPKIPENDCLQVYCFQHRIPFDYIPSVFWRGLIGIEDLRFLEHSGIDLRSIGRAIVTDIREMRLAQGGSTLTQQLVKNLFLTNEKTLKRKFKEIAYSIYIEGKLTKDQILEAYFNEVYWGALQGLRIKGLFSASVFYFQKPPQYLEPYEAAILIAMLKGPSYYSPLKDNNRLRDRTNVVFKKLGELNLFPSGENSMWTIEKWEKWKSKIAKLNKSKPYYAIWEASRINGQLLNDYEKYVLSVSANQFLSASRERAKEIKGHDLSVKIAWSNLSNTSSANYYSKPERNHELALKEEKHQVGSILKPIIYREFFQNNLEPQDLIQTAPMELDLLSGKWSPGEAGKVDLEEVTLREALIKSYNRPLIRAAQEVGWDILEAGIEQYIPDLKKPLSEYPSQLLGAVELSLIEVTKVYSKFLARECEDHKMSGEDDFGPKSIIGMLSDPTVTTIRRSSDRFLREMRFFGKTGTSNNGNDNWFIFFDGMNIGVFWLGNEGNKDIKLPLYGSSTSYQILQKFVRERGRRFAELRCDSNLASGPEQ